MLLVDDRGRERPIEAILFDMDGTLIDSFAATVRAWRTWAEIHGVSDRLHIAHGQPVEASIRHTIPDIDDETLARHVQEQRIREASDVEGVVAAPGTVDMLAWLDQEQIEWAVVTSADLGLARARLGAAGIVPPLLVTRDDVDQGKPHPEPFLLGAERVGVAPGRCLVVEDAQAGVDSGQAAGSVTAGLGDLGADIRLEDMRHLHRLLVAARA